MSDTRDIGKHELKNYERYECIECGHKEFGLCKVGDSIFPDVICIKCGCIHQR